MLSRVELVQRVEGMVGLENKANEARHGADKTNPAAD